MECYAKRSSNIVIFVFFLYKFSESLLQPTVRVYIYEQLCRQSLPPDTSSSSTNDKCHLEGDHQYSSKSMEVENMLQNKAAHFLLAYRVLLNLPAILICLCAGSWSDRLGRKTLLLLPCLGSALAAVFFVSSMNPSYSMQSLVLAGALFYGIFGKSTLMTVAANSYIADVSDCQERTTQLGRLLGINFFGIFAGSLLTGVCLNFFDYYVVFLTVGFLNLIIIFIAIFFVKESINTMKCEANEITVNNQTLIEVKYEKKKWYDWISMKSSVLLQVVGFLFASRKGKRKAALNFLFFAICVNQLCKAGEQDILLLLFKHSPLYWSGDMYGYYLAVYYGCMGVNLVFILPFLAKWFHCRDTSLILVGLLMKIVRLLMTAFSKQTYLHFLAAVLGCLAGYIVSGTRSIMSKFVDEKEIGQLFSLLSCVEDMSNLIGPTIFNLIYSSTVSMWPGLVFALDSCVHISLLFMYLRVHFQILDDEESS